AQNIVAQIANLCYGDVLKTMWCKLPICGTEMCSKYCGANCQFALQRYAENNVAQIANLRYEDVLKPM
ncbi:hypothetical protein L0128_20390, partial [candidate division KSB1 bacterium]|nr:hypothetical protein [candidate division KSB1 bacterium]